MPVSGWRYLKQGECGDCHDAQSKLYVPTTDGAEYPHFTPTCKECLKKYSLDILCNLHRLPVRLDGHCQLCVE